MRKRIACIVVFVSVFVGIAIAQKDSLYTDTIVIVKPPLIISQKVHISSPYSSFKPSSLDIGLCYGLYKNSASHGNILSGGVQTMGLQLKAHYEAIEIGFGFGIVNSNYILPSQRMESIFPAPDRLEILKVPLDTIEMDTVINNRTAQIEKIYYEMDTIVHTGQTYSKITFTQEEKRHLRYIQIPLSLGYTLHAKKWHATPSLQLWYTRLMGAEQAVTMPKHHFWLAGAMFNFARSLHRNILIEFNVRYLHNVTSIYASPSYQQNGWDLIGVGIGLYYTL